jgi:hypothetical protein
MGEQMANMLNCRVMARRPDLRKEEVLSRDDLKQLSHNLSLLSLSAARDLYERAYQECRITGRDFPSPRAIQQLVQAWKQLRKWK